MSEELEAAREALLAERAIDRHSDAAQAAAEKYADLRRAERAGRVAGVAVDGEPA